MMRRYNNSIQSHSPIICQLFFVHQVTPLPLCIVRTGITSCMLPVSRIFCHVSTVSFFLLSFLCSFLPLPHTRIFLRYGPSTLVVQSK